MTEQSLERMIAQKIRSFTKLPDGWHYGTGTSATAASVDAALTVNAALVDYGARNIEAFPGIDGDVLVAGYNHDDTLEIQCRPDGRMDLVHEIGDEPDQERGFNDISMSEVEAYLGDLKWLPKNSFVHYTRPISARRGDASSARLFSRLPEEGEYQFSRLPAPWQPVAVSANILLISTAVWLTTPMYSGGYVLACSQKIAGSPMSDHRQETPVTGIFSDWEGVGVRLS